MNTGLKRILLVEDDPRDVEITLEALSENNLGNEVDVSATARRPWITCTTGGNSRAARGTTPRSSSWISSCRRWTAGRCFA